MRAEMGPPSGGVPKLVPPLAAPRDPGAAAGKSNGQESVDRAASQKVKEAEVARIRESIIKERLLEIRQRSKARLLAWKEVLNLTEEQEIQLRAAMEEGEQKLERLSRRKPEKGAPFQPYLEEMAAAVVEQQRQAAKEQLQFITLAVVIPIANTILPTTKASPMIDLRSDTVTQPTPAMRDAMMAAPLGDDVFGDDPTVAALQESLAGRLGFAAGLFCPSGTMSNLCALMAHCGRGDEYIVGQDAHTYKYEGGGAAVLGSIQPQPLENAADGSLPLEKIAAAVKPDDPHFARTRLLALENTIGGKVLPQGYVREALALAREHGLATHLDGARFFNAAVASAEEDGSPAALARAERELAAGFDSISICLSKGLGAPAGSVLLGSHDLIRQAIRARKMLGGGMRQSGLLAAAGWHALENHVARLAEDHRNARLLAECLSTIPGLTVEGPHTNMVFVGVPRESTAALAAFLKDRHILIMPATRLRLVTHLGLDTGDMHRAGEAFTSFFGG